MSSWAPYLVRLTESRVAGYSRVSTLLEVAKQRGCSAKERDKINIAEACIRGCILVPEMQIVITCDDISALYDEAGLNLEKSPHQTRRRGRKKP